MLYEYRVNHSHVPEVLNWDEREQERNAHLRRSRAEAKATDFDPIESGPIGRYQTEAKVG